MIRVLVVDDEVFFCKAMRKMINEISPDIRVIKEAYDGETALRLIEETHIDVLVTDIRMQDIDGLELIEQAKTSHPDLLTVVLSAYSDFEYARRAILLNADDYLLKPATFDDMKSVFERMRTKHAHSVKQRELSFFEELLNGRPIASPPQSIGTGPFAAALVCAGSHGGALTDPLHPGKVFWQSIDIESISVRFRKAESPLWILDGFKDNEKIILIKQGNAEEVVHKLHELFALFCAGEVPVTLVFKTEIESLHHLNQDVHGLQKQLLRSIVFAKSTMHTLPNEETTVEDGSTAEKECLSAITGAIMQQHKSEFFDNLQLLFAEWERYEAKQYVIFHRLQGILDSLGNHAAIPSDSPADLTASRLELEMSISANITYSDLFQDACFIYEPFWRRAAGSQVKPGYHEQLARQIEQYLQEHYQETVMLQHLSQKFGFVPNYISTLFRKYKGVTPGEYITQIRIEQAKLMMQANPNILLKHVADAVGYRDALYFSRVFKKLTGRAPNDFLHRLHNESD